MISPNICLLLLFTFFHQFFFLNGEQFETIECDDQLVNIHMSKCYQQHIDSNVDLTSNEKNFYIEGYSLCQAYNQSSSFRQCLSSIYSPNEICSYKKYPFTYKYSKIYWKLILSSCQNHQNQQCSPSPLSKQILNKCHYSFDQTFPTKCKEFLRSISCLDKHEEKLVLPTENICSKEQAFYYFYGDLAVRLQLAINICEIKN